MRIDFKAVCAMAAAARMYKAGVPVKEVARQAKRSRTTIRDWLRDARAVSGFQEGD